MGSHLISNPLQLINSVGRSVHSRFGVAKLLTLGCLTLVTGCSYLESRTLDHCKSHAYLETVIEDYLTQRYDSAAPVRMGIVPFTAPANLASRVNQTAGIGNQLAWKIQANFLNSDRIPIVEVFNRTDWPGKKDEFFTGNFGALSFAREAGYDLIFVGILEELDGYSKAIASTKLIEVESGTTIWFGKTIATTDRVAYNRGQDYLNIHDRDPSVQFSDELIDLLSSCIVKEVLKTEK